MPVGGRWKSPSAWLSDIYEPVERVQGQGFGMCTWCRALSTRPRDARDDEGGLDSLFKRGFSGALHLGAIRLPSNDDTILNSVPNSAIIEVILLNDGKVPWAPGAKLCNLQSNTSQNVTATCWSKRQISESCSDLPVGGLVHLFIHVPFYLGHSNVKAAWYKRRFSLCDAADQPFGTLMSVLTSSGTRLFTKKGAKVGGAFQTCKMIRMPPYLTELTGRGCRHSVIHMQDTNCCRSN